MKKPIRILIAEDNEDHVFLAVRALRDVSGLHLEVDAVRDGAEALDYLHAVDEQGGRARPHLILLDIRMPKVDGLEVLKKLKADPELRAIPVVMLTSSERPEDIDASYQLGANSYVTKPVGLGALREGLKQIKTYWTQLGSLPQAQ
jgi:CheY-like chemotaxis protein